MIAEARSDQSRLVWSYSAPKKGDFYSFFISGAQRLPNGNTLICSGASGTIFEVTPDKEVVWKYTNPVMGNPSGPGGPGRTGGVDLFPFFVRDQLDLTPEQSKQIEDFQKELTGKLKKSLNDAQQKQVQEVNPAGPGGFAALPLPGQIISKSTLTALKPSAQQERELDDLQKEVDAKIEKLLTAEQKKQLKDARENFVNGRTVRRTSGRSNSRGARGTAWRRPGRPTTRARRSDCGKYALPRPAVRSRLPRPSRQSTEARQDD